MDHLTKEQYIKAIANGLTRRQIEILQVIYHRPNAAATAIELAEDMGYKGYQGANRQIGAIGQAFADSSGFQPHTYLHKNAERPRYYHLVGKYNGPGWKLWPELKKALETLNRVGEQVTKTIYTDRLPTEILPFEENRLYKEGKIAEVFVNRFERNQQARIDCIKYYGAVCQGCGFDFGQFYGAVAQGFIHVHHLIPLAEAGKSYKVDPIKDLVPLCANCHSVVHLVKPLLTLAQLKKLTRKNSR